MTLSPEQACASMVLGYIPFLEPIRVLGNYWWLLAFPLVLGISVIYRATHDDSLDRFWGRVFAFCIKSTVAMGGLAVGMYLFVYLVLPRLAVT